MQQALESDNPRMLSWMIRECRWFDQPMHCHMEAMESFFPPVMTPKMIRHYDWTKPNSRTLRTKLAHAMIKWDGLPCLQELSKTVDMDISMCRTAWRYNSIEALEWILRMNAQQCRTSQLKAIQKYLRDLDQCHHVVKVNDMRRLEWMWKHSKLALGVKRWPVEELLRHIAISSPDFCEWLLAHYPRYMRNFLENSTTATLNMEWLSSTRDFFLYNRHLPSMQWAVAHGARFDYQDLLRYCNPEEYVDQSGVVHPSARMHEWLTGRLAAAN
jgi:hypothetical protein